MFSVPRNRRCANTHIDGNDINETQHTATAVMPTAPVWLSLNAMTVSSLPLMINCSILRISRRLRSHSAVSSTNRPRFEKRPFRYLWSRVPKVEGRKKDAAMIWDRKWWRERGSEGLLGYLSPPRSGALISVFCPHKVFEPHLIIIRSTT